MSLPGMIVIGVGVLLIIIGLIFSIPYKNVSRFSGNMVQGQIVDMVWNAAMYNKPLDEAAQVEHYKFAGMEMQPGTRNTGILHPYNRVNIGNGNQDPYKPVVGRGAVNMYHKVYQYVVNGVVYTRADGVRYNKGVVEPLIGQMVPVYYNPSNPQQSTLSNGGGYKLTMTILCAVGVLCLVVGVCLI